LPALEQRDRFSMKQRWPPTAGGRRTAEVMCDLLLAGDLDAFGWRYTADASGAL
jgi:hypothetical protein